MEAIRKERRAAMAHLRERPGGPSSEPLISAATACELLGMKKSWLYDTAWRGELPSYRLGRSIRFRQSEIEQYIRDRRQSAP